MLSCDVDCLSGENLGDRFSAQYSIHQIAFSLVAPNGAALEKGVQFELALLFPFDEVIDAIDSRIEAFHHAPQGKYGKSRISFTICIKLHFL